MSIARQLIEALAEWNSCEDKPQRPTRRARLGSDRGAGEPAQSTLARTIEGEVIPRLMLAHRVGALSALPVEAVAQRPAPEDVAELARIVLEHDTPVATHFVEALRNRGMGVETVYVDLLAPTARLLGEMWKADLCDFTDVTIGLSRLQQIVMLLGSESESDEQCGQASHRILLVPMVGEQHTLGLMLVEEQFRRCGWECSSSAPRTERDLVRMVKSQSFDVIGISTSCEVLLDELASAIQTVRKASKNPSAIVLVGGGIFIDEPQYVSQVGADGTAEDGRQAVAQLRRVLESRTTGR